MVPPVSYPVAEAPVVALEKPSRTTLSRNGNTVPVAGRLLVKFGVTAEASKGLFGPRLASESAETMAFCGDAGLTRGVGAWDAAGAPLPPPPVQAASSRTANNEEAP